jgi:hypothetical protein
MRDLDTLLNSLVNIDRSLIAILSSEANAARQSVNAARHRTASQRAKRHQAERRAARIDPPLKEGLHRTGHVWPCLQDDYFKHVGLHYFRGMITVKVNFHFNHLERARASKGQKEKPRK